MQITFGVRTGSVQNSLNIDAGSSGTIVTDSSSIQSVAQFTMASRISAPKKKVFAIS